MSTVSQLSGRVNMKGEWQYTICKRPYRLPHRKRFLLTWETKNGWWWANPTWTSYRYGSSKAQVERGVNKDLSRLALAAHTLTTIEAVNDNQ